MQDDTVKTILRHVAEDRQRATGLDPDTVFAQAVERASFKRLRELPVHLALEDIEMLVQSVEFGLRAGAD